MTVAAPRNEKRITERNSSRLRGELVLDLGGKKTKGSPLLGNLDF